MNDTTPLTSPESLEGKKPIPLFLSNDSSMIADYIQRHKAVDEDKSAYSFCDFVKEMNATDFEDNFQIRAILESQAHLLGTAFNYLMLEGDWKNLSSALRAQRIMRDTMEAMNKFPQLSYMREFQQRPKKELENNDKTMD